jgi:hypothetical protein
MFASYSSPATNNFISVNPVYDPVENSHVTTTDILLINSGTVTDPSANTTSVDPAAASTVLNLVLVSLIFPPLN